MKNRANARWENIEKCKIIGFSTRNGEKFWDGAFLLHKNPETAASDRVVSCLGIRTHTDSLLENWDERDWLFSWIYCAFSLPHTRFWWTHFGLRASEESGENEEPQTSLAKQVIFNVNFRISLCWLDIKVCEIRINCEQGQKLIGSQS